MTYTDLVKQIHKARHVFVWVHYCDEDGVYVQVPKTSARIVAAEARGGGRGVKVLANVRDGDLYIG